MHFGTKKAQKALSSVAKNAISAGRLRNVDVDVVKDAIKDNPTAWAILDSLVPTIHGAPTRASLHAAIDDARPRPKANPNATKPEEVYPLETLVGSEVLKDLKVNSWIETVNAGEPVKSMSRFIVHRLKLLVAENNIAKLKVLKYISVLLDWYKALRPAMNGGRRLSYKLAWRKTVDASDMVLDAMKKQFLGKE